MGLRNPSRLSIDPETNVPYTAWVGPGRRRAERDPGPLDLRERGSDLPGGQLRLAVLHGQRAGVPRPVQAGAASCGRPTAPGYVSGGPATGGTDGWYDCNNLHNDSPDNTGLTELPHQTGPRRTPAGPYDQPLVQPRQPDRRRPNGLRARVPA